MTSRIRLTHPMALPNPSADVLQPRQRTRFTGEPGAGLLWLASLSLCLLFAPVVWAGPLALDEHVSYWMLDSEQPSSLWSRCLDYGAVPPLSSVLQFVSMALLGKTEFALRLPSLAAAWLAILVVYHIGHRLRGSVCGGVAACLLAWHPEVLDEVRIGRCYGLVVCLSACLLLTTLRWKENIHSRSRSVMWAFVATALLWTHYTAGLLVLVAWGIVTLSVFRADRPRSAVFALVIASSVTGVLCLPLWPSVQRLREWSPSLNMLAPETPIWQTISSFWWLAVPVGLLVMTGLNQRSPISRLEVTKARSMMTSDVWAMFACCGLPLTVIAACAVGDLSSLANPRYRVAYVPAGVVCVAWLLSRSGSWKVSVAGLLVTVCAAWSVMPLRPWQLGRLGAPAERDWHALNLRLATDALDGEPIFVQSGLVESSLVPVFLSDPRFLEYAASRVSRFYVSAPHARLALPYFWDEQTQRGYAEFLESLEAPVIWIACATDTDLNRSSLGGIQQIATQAGYRVDQEQTWPAAVLIRMAR